MVTQAELDTQLSHYADFPYSSETALVIDWYVERILKLVEKQEELSLLELGIGYGHSSLKFQNFRRHSILEGSKKAILKLRKKCAQKMEVIHTLFEDFETSEQFDLIVMGFILEHVDKPGLILRKFREFLKPKGFLFISVPNFQALNKRIGFQAGFLKESAELSSADLAVGHKRLFSVKSLQELLTDSGYVIERIEGIFLKPLTTKQLEILKLPFDVTKAMFEIGVDYPELCANILVKARLRNALD